MDENGEFYPLDEYYKEGDIESIETKYPLPTTITVGGEMFSENNYIINFSDGRTQELPFSFHLTNQFETREVGEHTAKVTLGGTQFVHQFTVVASTEIFDETNKTVSYTGIQLGDSEEISLARKDSVSKWTTHYYNEISAAALSQIKSVKKLSIPFALPTGALAEFENLEELTITTTGARALDLFSGSLPANLKTIRILNSSNIPAYFFFGCEQIETLITTSEAKTMSENGEAGLSGVKDITVSGGFAINTLASIKNVRLANDSSGLSRFFLYTNSSVENLYMPETVTAIDGQALIGMSSLEKIKFSDGLKIIGANALEGIDMSVLHMPLNVTEIGLGAFYGCNATTITFGKRVNKIGALAFASCPNLAVLKIPSANASFGNEFLKNSLNLRELEISGKSKITGIFSLDPLVFPVTKLTIYGNICERYAYELNNRNGGTNIILDESVKQIGKEAFTDCTIFTKIHLNKVEYVGEMAFWVSSRLTEVTATESLTFVDAYGLAGNPFFDSSSSIIIGDGVVVKSITNSSGVLEVEEGAKSIMPYAFEGEVSTIHIIIPASVTYIDEAAFFGKPKCLTITLYGRSEVPNAARSVGGIFYGFPSLQKIYVLLEYMDFYINGAGWSKYASLITPVAS